MLLQMAEFYYFSWLHNTPYVATLNGLKIIIFSQISQRKINLYDITYVENLNNYIIQVHNKTKNRPHRYRKQTTS